jgi:hypothetical protein
MLRVRSSVSNNGSRSVVHALGESAAIATRNTSTTLGTRLSRAMVGSGPAIRYPPFTKERSLASAVAQLGSSSLSRGRLIWISGRPILKLSPGANSRSMVVAE